MTLAAALRAAVPPARDLLDALRGERDSALGTTFVWLCVTESRWYVTTRRGELGGAYARCTVGRADSDRVLADLASDLLERIERVDHPRGGGGSVKTRWTERRLRAVINAVTAMLAGEEGEGDWDPSNRAEDMEAGLRRLQEELAALRRKGTGGAGRT